MLPPVSIYIVPYHSRSATESLPSGSRLNWTTMGEGEIIGIPQEKIINVRRA